MPRKSMTLDTDEQIGSYLLDQRTSLIAEAYRQKYPDITYTNVLFVETGQDAWADKIARKKINIVGKSKWGDVDSDDYPRVDLTTGMGVINVYERILGMTYSRSELIRAAQIGIDLSAEKAIAVRTITEQDLNLLALFGSKEKKMEGLYNSSLIEKKTSTLSIRKLCENINLENGVQAAVSFFQNYINQVDLINTNTIYKVEEIILPERDLRYLRSAVIPASGDKTLLPFLESNLGVKFRGENILEKGKIEDDDIVSLQKDRMMFSRKDKNCSSFWLPKPLTWDMPYTPNGGKRWNIDSFIRTAGTEIKIPKAFLYVDLPDYV